MNARLLDIILSDTRNQRQITSSRSRELGMSLTRRVFSMVTIRGIMVGISQDGNLAMSKGVSWRLPVFKTEVEGNCWI